jgi:hypothetical protein
METQRNKTGRYIEANMVAELYSLYLLSAAATSTLSPSFLETIHERHFSLDTF